MLDWEINLIEKKDRQHFLLSYIKGDANIAVTIKIFSMETRAVETLIDAAHQDNGRPSPFFTPYPREVDQVLTVLASISLTLDDALLYESLQDISDMGKFKFSIGSTDDTISQFLVNNDTKATEPSTNNDLSVDSTYVLDDLFDKDTKGNI